jgi:hypothetical protein
MGLFGRSIVRSLLLVAVAPVLGGSLGPRAHFDERILAAQNEVRAQIGAPPLSWDPELAAGAADWARYLSRSGRFEHSPDPIGRDPEGENIWGGTPGHYLPEQMVRLWAAEKKYFKPGVFPNNSSSGRVEDVSHYTQLIWRDTTHVGCALNSEGAEEILVCRYSSAGNVIGQRVI